MYACVRLVSLTAVLGHDAAREWNTIELTDSGVWPPHVNNDATNSSATCSDSGCETWIPDRFFDFELNDIDRCDLPRVAMQDLGPQTNWDQPLVITNMTVNAHLIEVCAKDRLLEKFGSYDVVLSNSVAHAYERKTVKFRDYVENMQVRRPLEDLLARDANSTWYLCGDNWWPDLVSRYIKPSWVPGVEIRSSLSFGLGGSGSGIPLHKHGPALLEIFSGRKRWFVSPPSATPPFDPNTSSFKWFHAGNGMDQIMMCTQHVGEALWLPTDWWHATLNVGETVFYLLFV
eukprot:GEMP01071935.1.p1 GENE.GEMP01071935.1~~GEMP01071935.1.p1  ORF type:complete len:288 (-),score=34.63 GEMP01071935.1:290-1153(-)